MAGFILLVVNLNYMCWEQWAAAVVVTAGGFKPVTEDTASEYGAPALPTKPPVALMEDIKDIKWRIPPRGYHILED